MPCLPLDHDALLRSPAWVLGTATRRTRRGARGRNPSAHWLGARWRSPGRKWRSPGARGPNRPSTGGATLGTEAALATALLALLACPDVVPATRAGARQYARHKPEETFLFQAVQEHLSSFLCEAAASGRGMPRYVAQAFEAYLCCGILAHGFSRAYCADCRRSLLVAFSCKKRGPCASCGARKMASEAAFVADHVWPTEAGARQWVLSLPFDLRAAVTRRAASGRSAGGACVFHAACLRLVEETIRVAS